MTNILELPDDVLFLCFQCLQPLDFVFVSITCCHFHKQTNASKYSQVNNYWKYQCEKQWDKVNHKCKTNDSCITQNYAKLFRSFMDFIPQTILGKKMIIKAREFENSKHAQQVRNNNNMNMYSKVQKLLEDAWSMKMTINKVSDHHLSYHRKGLLTDIVISDKVDMFKIYVCNMSDDDIKLKFDVKTDKDWIWSNIVRCHSHKIAKFILQDNSSDNNNNINANYSYNWFENIDICGKFPSTFEDTLLSYAAEKHNDEIVSLLLKHPNMTKEGINQGGRFDIPPLYGTINSSIKENEATQDRALSIVKMLLNDERMNHVNWMDSYGDTALSLGIRFIPQIARVLIDNDQCNINIQNSEGKTALHYCVKQNNVDLVNCFLKRKDIDWNICDAKKESVIDIAQRLGLHQIKQLFLYHKNVLATSQ